MRRPAFTLCELLVILVVMAIEAWILIPVFEANIERARAASPRANKFNLVQ
jgi:Tfp pilus assembly protein FimT